jgi:hypothetical protein
LKHLHAPGTVDPHQRVFVLRHAGDQHRHQVVDDSLTLFRTFKNGQWRHVAQ